MISAIVLAAGLSTRMGGRPKALLPLPDGETFLTRILATFHAAGIDDVCVVLGHEAEAVERELNARSLTPRIVVNHAYATGQFSSVLAGLNAVDRPGVQAMLMTLVDVPFVTPDTVRAVVARFEQTGAPVVRPVNGSKHGHPVLIARALFPALRQIDPALGAKPVVRAHVSPEGDVPIDDPGAFEDVDTPADYARLSGEPGLPLS